MVSVATSFYQRSANHVFFIFAKLILPYLLEVKCGGLFPSFLFVFYPFIQLFCRAKRPSDFGGWPSFCSFSLPYNNKAKLFNLPEMLFSAGSGIDSGRIDAAVPQQTGQVFQILLALVETAGKQMA